MEISLKTDKEQVKKNDVVNYTLAITNKEDLSDIIIEIIPSAEIFPKTNIVPETEGYALNENGILQIEIPSASSDTEIAFSGKIIKSFEKNTTAVIVTSNNNGSINEAYTQVTLQGHSAPVVPVICTLIFIVISAFLVKRFI